MLLDDIQKSITDMNEIHQLEQASKDSKKQENVDKLFSIAVSENQKIIDSLNTARMYLRFKPSPTLIKQIKSFLESLQTCIDTGLVQENKAKGLAATIKTLKDSIANEWKAFYNEIAEKRLRTLINVKSITPDKVKTGYAITKIRNGSTINYGENANLRLFADGIKEADEILDSLELTDEILTFLNKVGEERATILDLTDSIEKWIRRENLTTKFSVSFSEV